MISEVSVAAFVALTRASRRFFPRTSSRTGLILWCAHHDGGSTLVTDGVPVCGEAAIGKTQTKTRTTVAIDLKAVGPHN
jgi:hypothetical protein